MGAASSGLTARVAKPQPGNTVIVAQPFETPIPQQAAADALDLVTLMFNYHDLGHMGVDRDRMNRAVFAALKPGGLYVVADHSGRPGLRNPNDRRDRDTPEPAQPKDEFVLKFVKP